MSQLALFSGHAIILWLGAITPSSAQDISSIKSTLAAKQCPAAEYSHLHYDSRGCGFSGQKACDQQYSAPGQAWQDCYHQLHLCQEQIDADNKVIDEFNRVYAACKAKQSSSAPPSVSGSSDLARAASPLSRQRTQAPTIFAGSKTGSSTTRCSQRKDSTSSRRPPTILPSAKTVTSRTLRPATATWTNTTRRTASRPIG
ncbi:hypothetical protein [Bradyrhizobium sp. USDA 4473]